MNGSHLICQIIIAFPHAVRICAVRRNIRPTLSLSRSVRAALARAIHSELKCARECVTNASNGSSSLLARMDAAVAHVPVYGISKQSQFQVDWIPVRNSLTMQQHTHTPITF